MQAKPLVVGATDAISLELLLDLQTSVISPHTTKSGECEYRHR